MIRYSKILILCIAIATIIYSCAKEFSASNPFLIPAKGSLLDSSGDCLPSVVHGIYYNGVETNPDSNYVQLIVHVASVGSYKIVSDTANGLIFKDSGYFTKTGYDTIHLKAEGTPAVAQTDLFSVTFDSTVAPGCSFEVVVNDSTLRSKPAAFDLDGSPSACTNATVNGIYTVNTALTSANTITISANVTSVGVFNLTTNTVNGMTFSASGIFTSTGTQPVTLTATGTPAASGDFTFTPQGISGCSFDVTVSDAPVATGVFTCKIDGVLTSFNFVSSATIPTASVLAISGSATQVGVISLSINVAKSDNSKISAGTYSNTLSDLLNKHQAMEIDYVDSSNEIWSPASPAGTPDPFVLVITSITSTNVKGTFSGTIRDQGGAGSNTKKVTEGVFDMPIQ